MDFSLLCSCGPAGYSLLKKRTDDCAQTGHSYEFPHCRLPGGCRPRVVRLGLWRCGDAYLLYLWPPVTYQGDDPRLRAFFAEGCRHLFPSFRQLEERLTGLEPPGLFFALRHALGQYVLGQEAAVEATAFKLYGHICKQKPQRPLSLIFYGPTCVGKSELGKALAPALNRCLGQERYRLVWTELNTFTQAHSAYRLTGAPPGYVGYQDEPVLEAVRRCPYTVFMFDELDKAHPEVLRVFMSILDEGRCAARREDAQGSRELDFRRCIFLFTTNMDLTARPRLGFAPAQGPSPDTPAPRETSRTLAGRVFQANEEARWELVRAGVLREIAGRFGGLIGFRPLDGPARTLVTARQIAALGREYGLTIVGVAPAIAQWLTPADALSLRSTVSTLEGVLTPLLLRATPGQRLRLEGTPDAMRLLPA